MYHGFETQTCKLNPSFAPFLGLGQGALQSSIQRAHINIKKKHNDK
jgi:hypothetical protein